MPTPTAETCRTRAAAAQEAADAASLDNVKERELRARDTWTEMAERAERLAKERVKTEAAKAARKEAEALAAEQALDAE